MKWKLTELTRSRLASLLVKIKTISLCPFFTANITGVDPSYIYNNKAINASQ